MHLDAKPAQPFFGLLTGPSEGPARSQLTSAIKVDLGIIIITTHQFIGSTCAFSQAGRQAPLLLISVSFTVEAPLTSWQGNFWTASSSAPALDAPARHRRRWPVDPGLSSSHFKLSFIHRFATRVLTDG